MSVEAVACNRVYVAHDQPCIIWGKVVHAPSFRNDVTDKLMVLFDPALLVRDVRITVEDKGPAPALIIFFNGPGILELRPVVGEYDQERLHENTPSKLFIQEVKNVFNSLLCAGWKEEHKHETAPAEEERKQAFTGFAGAFDGVHFDDLIFRVSRRELLEFLESASAPVVVHNGIFFTALFPEFKTYPSWKVDVADVEQPLVKVVVHRFTRAIQGTSMY